MIYLDRNTKHIFKHVNLFVRNCKFINLINSLNTLLDVNFKQNEKREIIDHEIYIIFVKLCTNVSLKCFELFDQEKFSSDTFFFLKFLMIYLYVCVVFFNVGVAIFIKCKKEFSIYIMFHNKVTNRMALLKNVRIPKGNNG